MNKNKLLVVISMVYLINCLPVSAEISIEDKIACKGAAYNWKRTIGNSNCIDQLKPDLEKNTKQKYWALKVAKCELDEFLYAYEDCLNYPTIKELTKVNIEKLHNTAWDEYSPNKKAIKEFEETYPQYKGLK